MGRRIFNPMNYLDFEEPIKTLREQLDQAKDIQNKVKPLKPMINKVIELAILLLCSKFRF